MAEEALDFLKRFREIHRPDRRDPERRPASGEVEITEKWRIRTASKHPAVLQAVSDLADYFAVSMKIAVAVGEGGDPAGVIDLEETAELPAGHWSVAVAPGSVTLRGSAAALAAGAVRLEDEMNFAAAPVLAKGERVFRPLARLRSVHSGSGTDDFPDWQLNAILHAGFNAIEVFVTGPDRVRGKGECDLDALIDRAERFGLSTVFYSLVPAYKHPDDPDADQFFDRVFGELVRRHPKVRAIGLVGESLEFPSKDPATTGRSRRELPPDGFPDPRPSPGWYPCSDYPRYLAAVERAVHRAASGVEIFFSTYNWGYQSLEARSRFLEAYPPRLSLWVPWELFKMHSRNGLPSPVMDYTISEVEPGGFFVSEMEIAARRGIPLRAFTNFAGSTWDVGCVPFIPVPHRWAARMLLAQRFLREGKIEALYENHHYGWSPNPALDLGKALLVEPAISNEEVPSLIRRIARRDYGEAAADHVAAAWETWSRAMDFYVASNEDQYGPWRVGSAYPFYFKGHFTRTMMPRNCFFPGKVGIVNPDYEPCENSGQAPGALRYPNEIADLRKMLELWERGIAEVEAALDLMAPERRGAGERLYALGRFIRGAVRTTINIKEWYLANMRLLASSSREEILGHLAELDRLLDREEENTRSVLDCSGIDSRIGWEPTMGYVADRDHLNWKLRQLAVTRGEVAEYRRITGLRAVPEGREP